MTRFMILAIEGESVVKLRQKTNNILISDLKSFCHSALDSFSENAHKVRRIRRSPSRVVYCSTICPKLIEVHKNVWF